MVNRSVAAYCIDSNRPIPLLVMRSSRSVRDPTSSLERSASIERQPVRIP
jgi:hypothetical protein